MLSFRQHSPRGLPLMEGTVYHHLSSLSPPLQCFSQVPCILSFICCGILGCSATCTSIVCHVAHLSHIVVGFRLPAKHLVELDYEAGLAVEHAIPLGLRARGVVGEIYPLLPRYPASARSYIVLNPQKTKRASSDQQLPPGMVWEVHGQPVTGHDIMFC